MAGSGTAHLRGDGNLLAVNNLVVEFPEFCSHGNSDSVIADHQNDQRNHPSENGPLTRR